MKEADRPWTVLRSLSSHIQLLSFFRMSLAGVLVKGLNYLVRRSS
jgi:hypothetical protein